MIENTINATHAIVSLDVPLPGIIWGWMITLNMWAKSIGTGVVMVGAYLLYKYKKEDIKNLRWLMPVISFVALNVFLLFTLLDLHQPLRMVNIFFHPHFTSAITVGAWMATIFTGIMTVMAVIGLFGEYPYLIGTNKITKLARENGQLYDKLLPFAILLAIPVTLYTAIIMAEASARELWQAPGEMAQMMLAAFMAGSATLLLFSKEWSNDVKQRLSMILITAVSVSFILYMGEYFFSFKSSEAEATLAFIHLGGSYSLEFWFAMIVGFIAPIFILKNGIKEENFTLIRTAALMALIGLYFAKDVWLKIPQMIPLS
ncbi:putative Polysulphide reductase NrfD [Sulfurovum sp. enrichment culture clone C5]|uniref:Putative Polysulphide reductase NrfD n=1 Tax=Sulfurovum sp. enrichment culture clone C5 TaxID=497650 RepID=A0A0S4XM21_9BACT|nr:putative Polysulphide reductase NrfD [Sulfurovum sp. enrichment culture clone C5]